MTKAMANSARSSAKSIRVMQQKAFAKASAAQRKAANKIIESLDLDLDSDESEKPARRSLRNFFVNEKREQDEIEIASGEGGERADGTVEVEDGVRIQDQ